VELHQAADRFIALVPRNPAEARASVHNALQVLAAEPAMRWSCVALVLAGVALAFSRRAAATAVSLIALAVTGLVWLQVNHVREGVILLQFSRTHGLTEADLLLPVVLVIAGSLWLLGQLSRRRRQLDVTVTRVHRSVQTS
jgi:hypothetical protein